MILLLAECTSRYGSSARYDLAGQGVQSNALISTYLRRFQTSEAVESTYLSDLPSTDCDQRIVYRGSGWIDNRDRDLVCSRCEGGYRVEIGGVGRFWVSDDARVACLESRVASADDWGVEQCLIGPIFILALALTGTFCLHASAVQFGDGAVVFVGDSGLGKSTLGAFLDVAESFPGRRLADDIIPVTVVSGLVYALPRYPQLKLAPEQQVVDSLPEIPIKAIFRLSSPDGESENAVLSRLTLRDALLTGMAHTVAARLFDGELLRRKMEFWTNLVPSVPFFELRYPRRREVLPEVAREIVRELKG